MTLQGTAQKFHYTYFPQELKNVTISQTDQAWTSLLNTDAAADNSPSSGAAGRRGMDSSGVYVRVAHVQTCFICRLL